MWKYTRKLDSLEPEVVEAWIAREVLLTLCACGPCHPDYIRASALDSVKFFLREELRAEFDKEPQRQAFSELYEKVMRILRGLVMIRPYRWMLAATSRGHQAHDDLSRERSLTGTVYTLRSDTEWRRIRIRV